MDCSWTCLYFSVKREEASFKIVDIGNFKELTWGRNLIFSQWWMSRLCSSRVWCPIVRRKMGISVSKEPDSVILRANRSSGLIWNVDAHVTNYKFSVTFWKIVILKRNSIICILPILLSPEKYSIIKCADIWVNSHTVIKVTNVSYVSVLRREDRN